jgi:hypothetical protein
MIAYDLIALLIGVFALGYSMGISRRVERERRPIDCNKKQD